MQAVHDDLLLLYSSSLSKYISELTKRVKNILSSEMGLKVMRTRFAFNQYTYPIKIVLFEHPKTLGFFCCKTFCIGVHKQFFFSSEKTEVDRLLRHELAHYYHHITDPSASKAHGPDYRAICKGFGWDKSVYQSFSKPTSTSKKNLAMHTKIQKLLQLGKSANVNEAKSALLKVRSLVQKHNMQEPIDTFQEEFLVTKKILWQKRRSPLLQAIADILLDFLVIPILSSTTDGIYLELFGKKEDVEIGEYIAHILQKKLPELFLTTGLKGPSKRQSYYHGLVRGFKESYKKIDNPQVTNSLLLYQKNLQKQISLAHPHLKNTHKSLKIDASAAASGLQAGKNLKLHQGIHHKKKIIKELI